MWCNQSQFVLNHHSLSSSLCEPMTQYLYLGKCPCASPQITVRCCSNKSIDFARGRSVIYSPLKASYYPSFTQPVRLMMLCSRNKSSKTVCRLAVLVISIRLVKEKETYLLNKLPPGTAGTWRKFCNFEVALLNDLDTIDNHLDGPFLRSSLILRALKKRNEMEWNKTPLTCGCWMKLNEARVGSK